MINSCLTACKGRGIEHYHKKTQESQTNINDMDTIYESELDNGDIVSFYDSSHLLELYLILY